MIAVAALTCCAAAASAADLGGSASNASGAAGSVQQWAGFAVTGSAGRTAIDANIHMQSVDTVAVDGTTVGSWSDEETMPFGGTGWVFGGELSYRHAVAPRLYLGTYLGGDFSTARGQQTERWSETENDTTNNGADKTKWSRNYAGFAGVELGREIGSALVFARIGGAYGNFGLSGAETDEGIKTDHDRYGWTIGGGADIALGGAWSLRGEYRYIDWGSAKLLHRNGSENVGNGVTATDTNSVKIDTTEQVVTVGLTYRLGGN
jgi:opacity protein-like surface antigen